MTQSYTGQIASYTKSPSPAKAGDTIQVKITKAYVNSLPQQVVDVYCFLKDYDTNEQLAYTYQTILARGLEFSMSAITTKMPDKSSRKYRLLLMLRNPPGRTGEWHILAEKSFSIYRTTTPPAEEEPAEQSYSGGFDYYWKPSSVPANEAFQVKDIKAYVKSSPQQTVDVYAIIKKSGEHLAHSQVRVLAGGQNFSMPSITTKMPDISTQKYTLELWLRYPPGKVGEWHGPLSQRDFTIAREAPSTPPPAEQSYEGDFDDYKMPTEALPNTTFQVTDLIAHVNSNPRQTLPVYAIIYDGDVRTQIAHSQATVYANGDKFRLPPITLTMPDKDRQNYSLELWLLDPPNKPGSHELTAGILSRRRPFYVTRKTPTEQEYRGSLKYIPPGYVQTGLSVTVQITEAVIESEPLQTVDAYAVLKNKATNIQLADTYQRVLADGRPFKMAPITTIMPAKDTDFLIGLWIRYPPGKPADEEWHRIAEDDFTVKVGTQEAAHQYRGEIRKYDAPEEVAKNTSFTVNINEAVFFADPVVSTPVYGVIKRKDTGEDWQPIPVTVLGDGVPFSIKGIPAKMGVEDEVEYSVELWLLDPPSKPGWHDLDRDNPPTLKFRPFLNFKVKRKKSIFPYIPGLSDIIPPPDIDLPVPKDILPDPGEILPDPPKPDIL